MKSTTNSVTLSEFEIAKKNDWPDPHIELTNTSGDHVQMRVLSQTTLTGLNIRPTATIDLTQREMVRVGAAMLEAAGAQNISYTYTPEEKK